MRVLRRAGTYVVVDETFAELNLDHNPMPPPMGCVDGRLTVTAGSLSKAVWGGLRVGWARAEPTLVSRLAAARATTDMASPVLEQLLATLVLGRFDEILADRRAQLAARRAALDGALARHLPSWRYTLPAGGLFIWTKLPAPISTSLSVLAGEHGIALTPGPRFGAPGLLERYLRLPYSLAPEQLERAVTNLARLTPQAQDHDQVVTTQLSYVA